MEEITISFNEGKRENYYQAFFNTLGGSIGADSYLLDKGPAYVRIDSFDIVEDLDISLVEIKTQKPIVFDRRPDNDPNYIHIFISKEGVYGQNYDGEDRVMSSSTPNGMFIYNGLFPTAIRFNAGNTFKIIGFKINISSLKKILKDDNAVLQSLFETEAEGLVYHLPLSRDFERLIEDLFVYNKLSSGRYSMIVARGLEVFTNLTQSLKSLNDENSLFGLHVDDYQRLQKIKVRLTTVFDERFTVEELADEYGVSSSKLKRDFKQMFGNSIYQFYNNARMDEAYRRLKTGVYSVSEIGYDLGYSNMSKFTEMFKKIKGILPTQVVSIKK